MGEGASMRSSVQIDFGFLDSLGFSSKNRFSRPLKIAFSRLMSPAWSS
jgi:hypothetical protein